VSNTRNTFIKFILKINIKTLYILISIISLEYIYNMSLKNTGVLYSVIVLG
jgi:hypothetical protein